MVSRSRDQCSAFLSFGVEDVLRKAMNAYTDIQYDFKAALRDLGCAVELKEEWTGIKNKIHIENWTHNSFNRTFILYSFGAYQFPLTFFYRFNHFWNTNNHTFFIQMKCTSPFSYRKCICTNWINEIYTTSIKVWFMLSGWLTDPPESRTSPLFSDQITWT